MFVRDGAAVFRGFFRGMPKGCLEALSRTGGLSRLECFSSMIEYIDGEFI